MIHGRGLSSFGATMLRVIACSAVLSSLWCRAGEVKAEEDPVVIRRITDATWSMNIRLVLGYQYRSNSNYWEKGVFEEKRKEEVANPGNGTVRAVCLGQENNKVVFFTLRSFVDPFYPNRFVQGMLKLPLKKDRIPYTLEEGEKAVSFLDAVRYGYVNFFKYKDVGGGVLQVQEKLDWIILKHDPESPKNYGFDLSLLEFKAKETFQGGVFDKPHESISVERHFWMQKLSKSTGKTEIRTFEDHDVVLIYVPSEYFKVWGLTPPIGLGLTHPSFAVDLFLNRQNELFGFKFVLFGQETLDAIRNYKPQVNDDPGGFDRLIRLIGYAMGPTTLLTLEQIDKLLKEALPSDGKINMDKVLNQLPVIAQKLFEWRVQRYLSPK
jgi:hypothetical protein